MALRDYLAEEVALDFASSHLTRREALTRLALLGLSATAASTLLAACSSGSDQAGSARPRRSPSTRAPNTTAPAPTTAESITFAGPRGRLQGAYAAADQPRAAILVIHENRGLTPHIRSIPPRFAADGYAALAIDLLSEEGGTAAVGGDAQAIAALGAAPTERLVADMRAGIDELERRVRNRDVGMIGFCFGGAMTWALLAAGEPRLAAAAPFYGTPPPAPDFSGSDAAVLAVYAANDARVNATRDVAVGALEAAALPHEVRVYPGVGHAFSNDSGANYDADTAAQAYQAVLDWFARYLS